MITTIKDHGVREETKTGSVRDTQKGKPRYDLIPPTTLTKLALHYSAGSEKYGDRNWELGQPLSRYLSSAERHLHYFKMGLTDENHLIAAIWNLFAVDFTKDKINTGLLPADLNDLCVFKCGTIAEELAEHIESTVLEKTKEEHSNQDQADKDQDYYKDIPDNVMVALIKYISTNEVINCYIPEKSEQHILNLKVDEDLIALFNFILEYKVCLQPVTFPISDDKLQIKAIGETRTSYYNTTKDKVFEIVKNNSQHHDLFLIAQGGETYD